VPRFMGSLAASTGAVVPFCVTTALSSMESACLAGVACIGFDGGPCGVIPDSGTDAHDDARTLRDAPPLGVADVAFRRD